MSMLTKWLFTIRITLSNYLVYRVNFLLEFIGPALIFFFIRVQVWDAVYRGKGEVSLQGYTYDDMMSYQAWTLIVTLLTQAFKGSDLATDIRLGRMSAFLLYPFSVWSYHCARFFTFCGIQLCVATVTLGSCWWFGYAEIPAALTLLNGLGLCALIAFFWFLVQFCTGVMGFWFEETWMFRVILLIAARLASGTFIPLEFFPQWLRTILDYTPFPYLTYYPVRYLSQQSGVEPLAPIVSVMVVWLFLGMLGATLLWRKGLRRYSAAGM